MTSLAPRIYLKVKADNSSEVVLEQAPTQVISIEYEDGQRKADKLAIVIANYDLAAFDDPTWRKGNTIFVSFGYAGNMSPQREAIIQKVSGFTELRVECFAKSVLLNKVRKSRIFENTTRSSVAKKIAEENGYTGKYIDIEDTGSVLPTISQPGITDAAMLNRIARQQGFEWYIDFDGFHYHDRRLDQRPARTLTYFTETGRGDIIDVQVENDVMAKPGRVTKKGRDPITKEEFTVVGDNDSTAGRKVTSKEVEIVDPISKQTYWVSQVASVEDTSTSEVATAAEAEVAAKSKYKRAQSTTVKMSLTIVGDPQMLAKSVINLVFPGCRRLSGSYFVKEVRHTVSVDSYITEIKCTGDGHAGYGKVRNKDQQNGVPEVGRSVARTKGKVNDKNVVADGSTPEEIVVGRSVPAALESYELVDPITKEVSLNYREVKRDKK